ncbi:MAG: ATP-binding protein [Steroidobacteraceae bacterium]
MPLDAATTAKAEETRILVLPPTYADGVAISKLLDSVDISCVVVSGVSELCECVEQGAGCVVLSEEAVLTNSLQLLACLAHQPVWSELPLIILSKPGRESAMLADFLPHLRSVSVVERPMRMSTLLSLVRSNMRARMRQYQVRDFLREREQLLESERVARGEAERAGRMKDEFLATLSHELRTPLNAVLGWTHLLRKRSGHSDEVTNGLAVIERNARSQAKIIGDLLDMSRIISGKVHLEVQPVDMSAVIEATIETMQHAADAKAIRLSFEPGDEPSVVRGDPNRLQQVLWNLLTNAVKFTPHGGQVAVKLTQTDRHAQVEVADSGEGIDAGFLPHIFDRFRQADASSARRHGGLGLGLSIVRQLVELHGGSVSARSAGPGAGTTFRVVLPLMPALSRQLESAFPVLQPDALAEDHRLVKLRGLKVLVVDDEPDARALLERLLQDCQATVVTAASAEEAMRLLASESPDVLVSDIGMPGTDGYSLLRQIRALDTANADIPAVAVTAYVRIEDRVRAMRSGFQSHLSKPVEPAELLTVVQRLARPLRTH